ncbi:sorting nexin-33-like [Halichondria panicea]|uniref:sorting nexin-33-like n=1 Tax=Halichondria panicea TaxID=6063 RepID=UPI00312B47B0
MAMKARVLYDFDGDEENGELTIKEGDDLTILNQDIGDGWWEGELANGVTGLFPESYVELVSGGGGATMGGVEDEQFQGAGDIEERHDSFDQPPSYNNQKWDEEEEWETEQREDDGGYGIAADRQSASPATSQTGSAMTRAGTVRKNINRFSSFVKTGTETYVLGRITIKAPISETEKVKVVLTAEGSPIWEPSSDPFTIEIRDPERKKKYRGIKKFTAYSIIPSSTGRAVSRRFKHYDWLHDRLSEKFTVNCVPPLPDKQFYGRYGEDFIEKRREKLQRWTNRIARHPVLSRSEVVTHFILCDDEGAQWKAGKRRAEKDELIAGAFLTTIELPNVTVDVGANEAKVEAFGAFMRKFKVSLTSMRVKFIDHCNQMSGPFMGEFHKMAGVINGLATTFAMEDEEYARSLTEAIGFSADTYRDLGTMHAEQPRNDMLPVLDVLKEYLGLIFTYPDVVQIYKGASSKVRDCDKMKEEGRIDITDASDISGRAETIAASILAEVHHFQHERIVDFRDMMKAFLNEQITFYSEVVRKLEVAVRRYDEGTDL